MSDELKELQRRLINDIKNEEAYPDDSEDACGRVGGIVDGIKVALYEIAHLSDEYQDFNNKN